jgi:hypothetical protein
VVARNSVPTASAVKATAENEQNDEDDEKSGGIHVSLQAEPKTKCTGRVLRLVSQPDGVEGVPGSAQ